MVGLVPLCIGRLRPSMQITGLKCLVVLQLCVEVPFIPCLIMKFQPIPANRDMYKITSIKKTCCGLGLIFMNYVLFHKIREPNSATV